MTVTFYDRQDESNPLNGFKFAKPDVLLQQLNELSSRPPFFCEIESENGFKLLVGIAKSWSCVQHSAIDGSPPYLMASAKGGQYATADLEFLMENTPTPVPRQYILKADLTWEVISFFVETGQRSGLVDWREI